MTPHFPDGRPFLVGLLEKSARSWNSDSAGSFSSAESGSSVPVGLSTVEAVAMVNAALPRAQRYAGPRPVPPVVPRGTGLYAATKLDAGCDSFTQPFFSIGMLDRWRTAPRVTVRCGIAP